MKFVILTLNAAGKTNLYSVQAPTLNAAGALAKLTAAPGPVAILTTFQEESVSK